MNSLSGPGAIELRLRPVQPAEDEVFLYALYRAQYGQVFAHLPAGQSDFLVRMQFRARQAGYAQSYPASVDRLVLLGDVPIGRLWTAELDGEHRIVDIALMPDYCGQGYGTQLLLAELKRAAGAGKPLRLTVDRTNTRAWQWYERCGLVAYDEGSIHVGLTTRS